MHAVAKGWGDRWGAGPVFLCGDGTLNATERGGSERGKMPTCYVRMTTLDVTKSSYLSHPLMTTPYNTGPMEWGHPLKIFPPWILTKDIFDNSPPPPKKINLSKVEITIYLRHRGHF